MKRLFPTRLRLLAVIAVIAAAGFLESTTGAACRAYCHSEFHKYFAGLGAAEARINPVERVLFSVLLTTTKRVPPAAHAQQAPAKPI